jgi:hypothetical protein
VRSKVVALAWVVSKESDSLAEVNKVPDNKAADSSAARSKAAALACVVSKAEVNLAQASKVLVNTVADS